MTETALIEAPEIKTKASAIGFGLSASNWDEGFRIAKVLAASTLVPKAYQGRPEDVVVAMQYGSELGLPPMAALQSIAVINGRPGVYGDGFLGVIMAAPSYHKHVEYYELPDGEKVDGLRQTDYSIAHADDIRAVTKFWRRGIAEPFVGTFSIGDAKRAKLWGKVTTRDGKPVDTPWITNPARMLRWRARGYAGRDGFAAELRGLKLAEELHDYVAETIDVEPQPIPPPVRRSEKARAVTPPEATPDDGARVAPPVPSMTAEPPTPPKPPTPKPQPAPAPKPTPTPQPPPKAHETEHLAITQTLYDDTPANTAPFFEIRARVKKDGLAPIDYKFIAETQDVFDQAATVEGADQVFRVTWHHGKHPRTGEPCKMLDGIFASESETK